MATGMPVIPVARCRHTGVGQQEALGASECRIKLETGESMPMDTRHLYGWGNAVVSQLLRLHPFPVFACFRSFATA